MTDQPITMDRRIPFVDAVFKIIEGTAPLQYAVDELCEAEERTGVMIVGEPGSFEADGVMKLREGMQAPSIAEIIRLARTPDALQTEFVGAPELLDSFYREDLERFLNTTHLVLTGGDICNSYSFISRGPIIAEAGTWRWWGEVLADWANRYWFKRPAGFGQVRRAQMERNWEYMDFYERCYISDQIILYNKWADTALAAIREKNRQFFRRNGLDDLLCEG